MAKGGQGLPLSTIVLAVIAIMILVLLVLFATGSFNRLFGSEKTLEKEVTPDQLAGFKIGCEQACFQAQQLSKTADEFKASNYCSKKIGSTHCWDTSVSVSCSKTFTTTTGGTQDCKGEGSACTCT